MHETIKNLKRVFENERQNLQIMVVENNRFRHEIDRLKGEISRLTNDYAKQLSMLQLQNNELMLDNKEMEMITYKVIGRLRKHKCHSSR